MDFCIEIKGEKFTTHSYSEAIDYVKDKIAYWNNFNDDGVIQITIYKVDNDTPTLNAHVTEEIDTKDLFGDRPSGNRGGNHENWHQEDNRYG